MIIKFKQDTEQEIIIDVIGDTVVTEMQIFEAGDEVKVDICDYAEPPLARELQFGDGSMAFVTPEFWAIVEIL